MPRKPFLLRIDEALMKKLEEWAEEELRSVNGQIEFLLRKGLGESGRLKDGRPPASKKR